jgi:hypothetical protein
MSSNGKRLQAIAGLKARYCDFEGLELKFPKIKNVREGHKDPKHVAIPADKL